MSSEVKIQAVFVQPSAPLTTNISETSVSRPAWFEVLKYLVITINGLRLFILGFCGISGGYMLVDALGRERTDNSAVAIAVLMMILFYMTIAGIYLWFIPIRGAIKESRVRLFIHGIVSIISYVGLVYYAQTIESPFSPNNFSMITQQTLFYANSTLVVFQFALDIIETLSTFGLAFYLHHLVPKELSETSSLLH